MDKISKELAEIKEILDSANLLDVVRKEVNIAAKGKRSMVVGGEFVNEPKYEVVVMHRNGEEINNLITRRLKNIDNIEVNKIANITKSVLGIKYKTRRGNENES